MDIFRNFLKFCTKVANTAESWLFLLKPNSRWLEFTISQSTVKKSRMSVTLMWPFIE